MIKKIATYIVLGISTEWEKVEIGENEESYWKMERKISKSDNKLVSKLKIS